MQKIRKIKLSSGIFWIEVADANLRILCGCPADAIKHLIKRGLVVATEIDGVEYETGPNTVLLSDISLQNGVFSNMAEFPVLHMLYKQGMAIPGHPNHQIGKKPLLIGHREQVKAQLRYIYRGNYGLVSREEMQREEDSAEVIDELMAMKLKFAFGKIKDSDEFLDSIVIENTNVEIKNGVFIERTALNVFEIKYQGDSVTVDLNLQKHEKYEACYELGYYHIEREFFAVIHSGDGDGWDENRPCMASILMFQGKIYLIDMGPNLPYTLNALGIGVNEIEGVFHTHAHDDHFAGITSLILGDHKIKYYASPLVRASVSKKLSALLSIHESSFYDFFDVHDLKPGVWNDIDDLEVMPVISPHPVETNIFTFRALAEDGYRSYAHLADIVSLKVLKSMIKDKKTPGISQQFFDSVVNSYFEPVNIKKIDIGGGMVHGAAYDFEKDKSSKIVLSHTSAPANALKEREIGSCCPFGMVDVLIPNYSEFEKRSAYQYLASYFPDSSRHQLRGLLNNKLIVFNPSDYIFKQGDEIDGVYLILTGNVEIINSHLNTSYIMSSGGLVGDLSVLNTKCTVIAYQASTYVKTLFFPARLYLAFVKKNNLQEQIETLNERRAFLQQTFIFGDSIPYSTQNKIAQVLIPHRYKAGEVIKTNYLTSLNFIIKGAVERIIGEDFVEEINAFNVFGEDITFFHTPSIFSFKAKQDTDVFLLDRQWIEDIPIVRWKLIELYEKRRLSLLNIQSHNLIFLRWRDEYSINIHEMDQQHRVLFDLGSIVLSNLEQNKEIDLIIKSVDDLISSTKIHFYDEEKLLLDYGYADFESHQQRHINLIKKITDFKDSLTHSEDINKVDFMLFFKDWLINHILAEDRHYGSFLNEKNIF